MNKKNIYKNIEKEKKMLNLVYGVSDGVMERKTEVIRGVREKPEKGTSGWYIWDGGYSSNDDFYKPIHGECMLKHVPEIEFLLELPVEYNFIFDINTKYLDIWKED